jgi:hypothetical protein
MDRTALFLAILVASSMCIGACAATASSASPQGVPSATIAPSPTSAASPSVSVAEVPFGDIPAGSYDHERFSPRLKLTLGPGWHNLVSSERDYDRSLFIRLSPEPGGEALMFDVEKTNLSPQDSIDRRLELMPDVDAGPTESVTYGGADGLQVEGLTLKETGVPAMSEEYFLSPGDRFRLVAIDVAGETLFIVIEGSDDDWPSFILIAEQVLSSLTFP